MCIALRTDLNLWYIKCAIIVWKHTQCVEHSRHPLSSSLSSLRMWSVIDCTEVQGKLQVDFLGLLLVHSENSVECPSILNSTWKRPLTSDKTLGSSPSRDSVVINAHLALSSSVSVAAEWFVYNCLACVDSKPWRQELGTCHSPLKPSYVGRALTMNKDFSFKQKIRQDIYLKSKGNWQAGSTALFI